MRAYDADKRLEELLAERGVRLSQGPGSGPPRVGAGADARTAWEVFVDAAREPAEGHGDDPHDDMLLFDGRWGTATPATGVGWAPAGDEPAVFRVHVSRTFTWYDADDEWEDKMSLTLMIEFLGEVGTVGEAQVTGYGGPPREGIGDAHDTEIRDWAGQVDTCAVAVESCAPFAAFDALSPTQFLVCFDSAY